MAGSDGDRRRRSDRETRDPGRAGFHYSREERLGYESDGGGEEPRGIFRRNRSLAITLIDVLVVLLMFGLYLLFFRPEPGVESLGGYRFEGNAFRFDGDLYVTLTATRADDAPAAVGEASLLRVEFPGGEVVTDVLPTDPDFPTVVRHVAEADRPAGTNREDPAPAGDEVGVTVSFADHRLDLVIPLESAD